MKILLLPIIIFSLLSSQTRNGQDYFDSGCRQGVLEAGSDLEKGFCYKYILGDGFAPIDPDTGLLFKNFRGCIVSNSLKGRIDGYNDTVHGWMSGNHGKLYSYLDIMDSIEFFIPETISIWRNSFPKSIISSSDSLMTADGMIKTICETRNSKEACQLFHITGSDSTRIAPADSGSGTEVFFHRERPNIIGIFHEWNFDSQAVDITIYDLKFSKHIFQNTIRY